MSNARLLGLYASALEDHGLGPVRGFGQPERGEVRVLRAGLTPRRAAGVLVPYALGAPVPGVETRSVRRIRLDSAVPSRFMADGEHYPFQGVLQVTAGPVLTFVPAP